ncbi:MAG: hypothetical protein C4555_05165 [Dehalococcoidia bacterium]|nr:MAG: hypothetical protein C4555_05165 [Dehalococcoidia bacterium]
MADVLPGTGEGLAAEDAMRDFRQGNYLGAGINALGALPAFPIPSARLPGMSSPPHRDLGRMQELAGTAADPAHRAYFAERAASLTPPVPAQVMDPKKAQKAAGQGYDLNRMLFHGTPSGEAFQGFDLARADPQQGRAVFLTDRPDIASTYATTTGRKGVPGESPSVYPVVARHQNPAPPVDLQAYIRERRELNPSYEARRAYEDIVNDWRGKGYDFGAIENLQDWGGRQTQFVALEPNILRSPWAKFDARRLGSSDLLASAAPVGAAGALPLMARGGEAQAAPGPGAPQPVPRPGEFSPQPVPRPGEFSPQPVPRPQQTSGADYSQSRAEAYIRAAAAKRGIDPEVALNVARTEGLGPASKGQYAVGDKGKSFGPYQLYTGGGLGNEFQKKTGLDPSDPKNWRQGVDFALDTAKQRGWGAWRGPIDKQLGLGQWGGIKTPGKEIAQQGGWQEIKGDASSLASAKGAATADTPAKALSSAGVQLASVADLAMRVQGKHEVVNKAEIQDFLKTGGQNIDPAKVPWCAAFVNSALSQAGINGSGSLVATSFANWGQPVQGPPQKGDVLVQMNSRFDGQPLKPGEVGGHVGIATGRVAPDGRIEMISGNKSNAVSTTWESPSSVIARRAGQPSGLTPNVNEFARSGLAGKGAQPQETFQSLFTPRAPWGAGGTGGGGRRSSAESEREQALADMQKLMGVQGKKAQKGRKGGGGGGKGGKVPEVRHIPGASIPPVKEAGQFLPRMKTTFGS